MQRLLRWVWFPSLLGLSLWWAGLEVSPNNFGGTYLFIFGLLVFADNQFWQACAFSAVYLYEGDEPEIDWWKITRDAYEPGHFYIRLLWLLPISLVLSIAVTTNQGLLWIVSGCALCAYIAYLVVRFRKHIMDYMDSIGLRLKTYSSAAEARFDTRNPEDRQ